MGVIYGLKYNEEQSKHTNCKVHTGIRHYCEKSEKEAGVICVLNYTMRSNHDARMGMVHTGTKHYYEKAQKQVSFVG